MIWEGVSADPAVKDTRRVRVLLDRTEVEHPVAAAVAVVEEALRVRAPVAVEALEARRGVAHDEEVVGDVCEVCVRVYSIPW